MKRNLSKGNPSLRSRIPWTPYLFIAPFIISFIVFFIYPAGYSLFLSFTKYSGRGLPKLIGLSNYSALFNYRFFWQAIGNSLCYFVAAIIPSVIISFLIAYAIHSPNVRYKSLFKIGIYLPQTMAAVAASLVFIVIFGTRTGVLNKLLGLSIPWLEQAMYTRWSVVILLIWRGIGWYMLIYLSGLATLDHSVIESAKVDGATGLRVMTRIVIPIMRPIFAYTIIIGMINSIKIYTEPRVLLMNVTTLPPAVQPAVAMLVTYVQSGAFGMASAIGWVLFLLIFAIYLVLYCGLGFGREES